MPKYVEANRDDVNPLKITIYIIDFKHEWFLCSHIFGMHVLCL